MLSAAQAAAAVAALYTSSSYYCARTRAAASAASRDQTEHPTHAISQTPAVFLLAEYSPATRSVGAERATARLVSEAKRQDRAWLF